MRFLIQINLTNKTNFNLLGFLTASIFILSTSTYVFAQSFDKLFEEGNKYFEAGDYKKAIVNFQKAAEINSNFAPLYNLLGMAYERSNGEFSQIVWNYKVATDIDPKYAEAFENLGRVYFDNGKLDKAEEYFRKLLSLRPGQPNIQFSLAWLYLRKKQPAESIYYFKEVVKHNPIPYAYYGLGMAYSMNGNFPQVLENVTLLRKLGEDDLAAQLEEMIRTPLPAQQPEDLAIQPPLLPPPPAPNPSVSTSGGVGGVMRVRLKGKLFSGSSAEESEPKKPQPVPSKNVQQSAPPRQNRPSGVIPSYSY